MKIAYLTIFFVLFCVPQMVFGVDCMPEPCSTSGGNDDLTVTNLSSDMKDRSTSECYTCEKDHCENGSIVYKNDYSKFFQCKQSSGWFSDDHWLPYEPGQCDFSECERELGKANLVKTTINSINDSVQYMKREYIVSPSYNGKEFGYPTSAINVGAKKPCYCTVCEDGYIPDEKNKECVEDKREEKCKEKGGEWDDGEKKCKCDSKRNLESTEDNLCKCKDGTGPDIIKHTDGYKYCETKEQIEERVQQEQNKKYKKNCENTGGEWDNVDNKCRCSSNKGLQEKNNQCDCQDGHEWNSKDKKLGCIMTPEGKCRSAKDTNVIWDAGKSECTCNDLSKYKYDPSSNKCKKNGEFAKCDSMRSEAIWKDNECVCVKKNKKYVDGTCEYTEEHKQKLQELTTEIDETVANIEAAADGLESSKWRNEDGKFNTARLASDAAAGVVLGTIGGVVSSKIIKKKQVENGFEDIRCVVADQEVAEWGDEFQIGLR